MGKSPSHKFGQIIGDLLEVAIEPFLREFTKNHDLYLDYKGNKREFRKGKKITWIDYFGNKHDLDFVIERGASSKKLGDPVAFIESAWRRYTKHSKNKAQEIQAAILPLVAKYEHSAPWKGIILAGEFTTGAMNQLKSNGFGVLHFTYGSVVAAFKIVNIDANFNESTSDAEFAKKVQRWQSLSASRKSRVIQELIRINLDRVEEFVSELESSVNRTISSIIIVPLYGSPVEYPSVKSALNYLEKYGE